MNKKNAIKNAIKNGFLHIFSASLINKLIQFGTSIILVRLLSKESYGQWSYAYNILSIFLLMQGLGVVPGILQYVSETDDYDRKLSYLKYGLEVGLLFNLIIAFFIPIYNIIFKMPLSGSKEILNYLFLIPLFTILYEIIQVFLRATLRNKHFSYITVINSATFFIGSVLGAVYFEKMGIVLGRYISYFVSVIVGYIFLKDDFKRLKVISKPEKNKRKEFLKYSTVSMLSNAISGILYLIDTFLVGMILKNETVVASYKTATLIPFALNFIPISVITFVYPYFAKFRNDKKKVKYYYNQLLKYLSIVNFILSLFLFVFAPYIIRIFFGVEYMDSLIPFRILSIGYFITGTFRIPGGNIIASQKKVKINFYNSIVSGIANIFLDIFFIINMGANGAAIATVLIFLISSIISNIYLYKYLR
jgi:O-antigen/teichoic acid export membrane protein